MAEDPDLVDVLAEDHSELRTLLDLTLSAPVDAGGEDRLTITISELVRHLVVEEDYLYPAVRELVPDGHRLAEEALAQSASAERLAKRIESASPGDAERDALVHDLRDSVMHHVRTTEAVLFPRLRQHGTPGQLRHLAGEAEMAKSTAPTRPHPHAPRTPPWNQILTPGIGLVDRVRDAMTGRATKPGPL